MTDKQKADLLAFTHLFWLLLGLATVPLIFIFPFFVYVVWAYVILTLISKLLWGGCVLRVWEKQLRERINPSADYGNSFIGYYLRKFFSISVSEKVIRIAFLIFMFLVLALSFIVRKPAASLSDSPADATYTINGRQITLVNGVAEIEVAPGSATKEKIRLFGEPTVGDINGDGVADAAVILEDDPGGSGTFYYVSAAVQVNGRYQGLNAILLGDRVAPQTLEISNGTIIANYADRNPGEPMTARPSLGVSKYIVLKDGKLVEIQKPFEVNFTATGNIVNKGSASMPQWTLVYERPGAPALTVTLVFNDKSVCDTNSINATCAPFYVANGTRAAVEGQNIGGTVTVSTLSVIE